MPHITFRAHDGRTTTVEALEGAIIDLPERQE